MKPAKAKLCFFLATVFCSGRLPAPGTAASLLCSLPLLLSPALFSPALCLVLALLLSLVGFAVIPPVLACSDETDPGEVVIDEAAGQFLAFAGIPSWLGADALWVLAAFALFRVFDILKPWPICALERLPGSRGIMADDLLCGLFAFLILRAAAAVAVGL